MLELDKDRFAQLLREVPEKDVLFPEPQYSPYIQSLIDRLKEEESLDLAAIDWSAFEMADVTIPFFQDNADGTSRSWMILYCKRELARIESAEAKAQAAHTSIRKEAA